MAVGGGSAEAVTHKSSTGMEAYALQTSISASELKGPEINAPIYPVETKHNFPPEAPIREEPMGKDELKYPVYGVDGKHSFKEKTPAALDAKHLAAPIFDVKRGHG